MNNASPHRLSRISKYLAAFLWVAVVAVTYFILTHYIDEERARHLKRWEQRLSFVAYAQAEQIGAWLAAKERTVRMLADDMSLRLYLSTSDESEEDAAQQTYLRNYIFATANQAGFIPAKSEADSIRANVEIDKTAGLAVVDVNGTPIVATAAIPDLANIWVQLSGRLKTQNVVGPVTLKDGSLSLLFHAPIYPVQGDASTDDPIGYVVGAIAPETTVFEYLNKGESPTSPAFSILFAESAEGVWHNLSGLWNKRAPLTLNVHNTDADKPAIVMAAREPGRLMEQPDLLHLPSLAFGIEVPGQPWRLVRRVGYGSAFSDLNVRMQWLHAAYWLMVASISLLIFALWRHVTADKLAKLLGKIRAHEELLTLVTERMPARLFITDSHHTYRYANAAFAQSVQMESDDVEGKTMGAVMGNSAAEPYVEASVAAMKTKNVETRWHEIKEEEQVVAASEIQHIPLQHIPSKSEEDESGVLVIEHDLTEVIRAKHTTQLALNKLIETLVMMVDMRDPHAARHSAGVAMMAGEIALTMKLDKLSIDTVAVAGRLMNIGKLLVPVDLLTSAQEIGEAEKAKIHEAMQTAIKHLETIPFEGPVVATLQQAQERPDGAGPLGIKESDIVPTAAILSVANSFVAITSPRSYRAGKTVDEAIEILQHEAGTAYVKPVVSALVHYLDNMGGREQWQAFADR